MQIHHVTSVTKQYNIIQLIQYIYNIIDIIVFTTFLHYEVEQIQTKVLLLQIMQEGGGVHYKNYIAKKSTEKR